MSTPRQKEDEVQRRASLQNGVHNWKGKKIVLMNRTFICPTLVCKINKNVVKISICQANKATRPGSILSFTKKKKYLLSSK